MSISNLKNTDALQPHSEDQTVILIAEDDVMVANVVRVVLENDGHFILTASDGEDALLVASQFNGPVHLLLSDIKMPRMNGFELRERIMVARPELKVLFMSGETEEVGRVPLLRKPFLPNDLRRKVRQIIDEPQF